MIDTEFYPTDIQYNPDDNYEYQTHITKQIPHGQSSSVEISDYRDLSPYWIGNTQLPSGFEFTTFSFQKDQSNELHVSFRADSGKSHNFTYVTSSYNANYDCNLMIDKENGAVYTGSSQVRVFNKAKIGTLCNQIPIVDIWATFCIRDNEDNFVGIVAGDRIVYFGYDTPGDTPADKFQNFMKYVDGTTTKDATVSTSWGNISITGIALPDFSAGAVQLEGTTSTGYKYNGYMWIGYIELLSSSDLRYPFNYSSTSQNGNSYVASLFQTDSSYISSKICPMTTTQAWPFRKYILIFNEDPATNLAGFMPYTPMVPAELGDPDIIQRDGYYYKKNRFAIGWEFDLAANDPIVKANYYQGQETGNFDPVYIGNCVIAANYYNSVYVFQALKTDDILKFMAMSPNIYGGGAPIFEGESPVEGEFSTDPEELQDWQSPDGDISDNDYDGEIPDDEDIPDDENPDDIEPGEKGDSGDTPLNFNTPHGLSGFTTMYALNINEVMQFGDVLWADIILDETKSVALKNFYTWTDSEPPSNAFSNADILDYVVSLRWYPFSITQYSTFQPSNKIWLGTGYHGYAPAARYITKSIGYIAGGSVKIPYDTKTFLDAEPNTSISIYVPFCGSIEVQPSLVLGRTLTLHYYVDFCTGTCTAYITASGNGATFVVGKINGTMGFDLLLTGNNASTMLARATAANNNTYLSGAQSVSQGVANALGQLVSKDPIGAMGSIVSSMVGTHFELEKSQQNQALLTGLSPLTCGSAASMSDLGMLQAFVQIRRHPMWNKGLDYGQVGYLSDRKITISNIKNGVLFQCINPELNTISATSEELSQIGAMLSSGVFK